jgi:hypothetical protein
MLRPILLSLAVSLTLTSCDPGFAVILNNNSDKERNVTVNNISRQELSNKDSMVIADTSSLDFFSDKIKRQKILLASKDTVNNSYSFTLEKGKRALLQGGVGWPNFSQIIVIDNQDTILLRKDKRTLTRKKFMYTLVSTTIE